MGLHKEDLEKKQDELMEELCVLLEKAGRGGASSRVFEVPEYARRRVDIALSSGELTGHFKELVITDWKRKEHHEGDVVEERINEQDLLTGVAVFLNKHGLKVFSDDAKFYVLGIERYEGIPVEGLEVGQLYELYAPGHTDESWEVTSDGAPLAGHTAKLEGKTVVLRGRKGEVALKPFDLSEAEYIKGVKARSSGK